jgi:hypothetical protein
VTPGRAGVAPAAPSLPELPNDLTHMHRDHAENLEKFPRARVTVARAEYEFCAGPIARKALFGGAFAPEEASYAKDLMQAEALNSSRARSRPSPGSS